MTTPLKIELIVDDKGTVKVKQFASEVDRTGRKGKKAFDDTARSVQKLNTRLPAAHAHLLKIAGGVVGIGALYLAFRKLNDIVSESVKEASDLEEVASKFNVVFAGQIPLAEKWSKTLVESYAMSTRESKQYLSSVQDLLVPMGMQANAAAKLSNEIVKLSADLGSFNNLPTAKVMDDIQSALVGNYETMKKYGVVLNATVVQERALAMGLADTKDALTAGQKAQAAYALMVEGSTAAIGDMARTSDSYANQVKQLEANIEDLKAMFGTKLLPVVTDIVKNMNLWVKENQALIDQEMDVYARNIGKGLMATAKALAEIAKYAGLKSVLATFTEGAKLAGEGLLDWDKFVKAGFLERQEMVEAIIRGHQIWRGTIEDVGKSSKDAIGPVEKLGKAGVRTSKELTKAVKALASEIKDLNEEVESGLFISDWEMTNQYQLFAGYEQAAQNIEMTWDEMQADIAATNSKIEDNTKETTEKVWTLWDEALNRVEESFADTFYHALKGDLDGFSDIFSSFLDGLLRMFAEKLAAMTMAGLFGTATGAGAGPTGTGTGGGFGSLWDWLGLAKSGYEGITGNSLIGSLYDSIFGGGSSYTAAGQGGYFGGMGPSGAPSYWGAGGTMFGTGMGAAYGSAAVGGGVLGGAGTAGGAGAWGAAPAMGAGGSVAVGGLYAAAVMAAIMIITAIIENQDGSGPSKLATESLIKRSQDPNRLFQGEMNKIYTLGGEWSDEDAEAAALRIAGLLADTLDTYNVLFENLSDASQDAISQAIGDIDNLSLHIREFASPDSPIFAFFAQRTPNEISEKEWQTLQNTISGKWIGGELGGPFGQLSETMKDAIVEAMKDGGKLTGQALADIMGVSYEDLASAFSGEMVNTLKEFIDDINAAFKGGEEYSVGGASIPEVFQKQFGQFFEDYIEEALTNIRGKEIFGWMTDEIQDAINSLDLGMFLDDIEGFAAIMKEHGFDIQMAGKVWGSFSAFVGRATDEVTAYEVARQKAQIQMAAYVAKMAEFGIELTEEDLADKTKEILEALTGGIDDLEAATKPLGQMGQLMAALNGQFDAYLDLLKKYGVDLEKINQLESMRLEATERLLDEYKAMLGLFGPDFAKNLRLDEIEEKYKRWGLSFEEMIEAFKNISLEELKKIADAMGIDWTEIADDIGWLVGAIGGIGDATEDAAEDVEDALATIKAAFGDMVNQILINLKNVQDQINFYSWQIAGGGSKADYLMMQIGGLQAKGGSITLDELLAMSEKLAEWYSAAVGEAQQAAQEEANVIRLWEQVADRVSSLVDQVDQTIRSIKYSDLNVSLPFQKAGEAQQDYDKLLSAAMTGGPEDVSAYLGFASTFLKMQQEEYKSSPAYQAIYAEVLSDMETIKGRAEAGGYDQLIYEEMVQGNEQVHVDLTDINNTFLGLQDWIQNALYRSPEWVLTINWANFTGDMADVMTMLGSIVDEWGWDNEFVIDWIFNLPMSIFKDFEDAMELAGFIAGASGGWESKATLSFLKNLGENWEFENIDEVLAAIGWVKEQAGSWSADATVTFIAALMDASGTPIADMPYWLDQLGVTGTEIPTVMAKLVMQMYDINDIPLDDIDGFLESLGITNEALRRSMEVELMFNFAVAGDIDLAGIADWMYAKIVSALLLDVGDPKKYALLGQVESMATMFGVFDAFNMGRRMGELSPLAQAAGWTGESAGSAAEVLWQQDMGYTSWAEGGIANEPTWGVFGEAGPEAFLRLASNQYVPVPSLNGGSTQAGANRGEEIELLKEEVSLLKILVAQNGRPLEIGGKALDRYVDGRSDNVRVKAERRPIGARRI